MYKNIPNRFAHAGTTRMTSTHSLRIISVLWFFSWTLGLYIKPLFGGYRYYYFLLILVGTAVILWQLRRSYGMRYFYLGLFGLFIEIVFSFLSSPHRMDRLKMWLDGVGF
jgi:hypothetical protein